MLILGVHSGYHDACACLFDDYEMRAAVALERLTRRKIDGGRVPVEAIDECLAIAGKTRRDVDALVLGRAVFPWRYYTHFSGARLAEGKVRQVLGREKHKSMERELVRARRTDSEAIFDRSAFLRDFGLRAHVPVRFFNHHLAHALPTLFHTDWDEALLYTADGGGDNVQYSHRLFRDGRLETLYGGDEAFLAPARIDSLGLAYGYATQALGFRINRHEGKVTGLAASGRPVIAEALACHFRLDDNGQIFSDFESYPALRRFIFEWAAGHRREDVAASVQKVLEDFVIEAVKRLLVLTGVRRLGLSGGVFANVRLNQRLAEELPLDEVFIYPAMSDQGLAAGGVLQFLLERDGLKIWLSRRWRLDSLYYGRSYGDAADALFAADPALHKVSNDPVSTGARLIHEGRIVGLFAAAMEYGPRALGARSILAAPVDAAINKTLSDRLERSEFMPFAPVVRAEDASLVFELGPRTLYAARFMTITCGVRAHWLPRIPAVVHVDGTARPQVIERPENPLYYDILTAYARLSGIPVLINTSFNVHEEPIINAPAECARALREGRVDFVATAAGVWGKRP
jgi:Predicted carbamoyl transferase, NodU family